MVPGWIALIKGEWLIISLYFFFQNYDFLVQQANKHLLQLTEIQNHFFFRRLSMKINRQTQFAQKRPILHTILKRFWPKCDKIL